LQFCKEAAEVGLASHPECNLLILEKHEQVVINQTEC